LERQKNLTAIALQAEGFEPEAIPPTPPHDDLHDFFSGLSGFSLDMLQVRSFKIILFCNRALSDQFRNYLIAISNNEKGRTC
jgi:hypothetical protein